jgi:hypothetical protein
VLGVVYELLLVEEKLLTRRKNEFDLAVYTPQNPVSKFHCFFLSGTNFRLKQTRGYCFSSASSRGRTRASSGVFGRGSDRAAGNAANFVAWLLNLYKIVYIEGTTRCFWNGGDDEHADDPWNRLNFELKSTNRSSKYSCPSSGPYLSSTFQKISTIPAMMPKPPRQ